MPHHSRFTLVSVLFICFALVLPLHVGVQAAADDLTGAWAFVMNTDGGDRNVKATFKLNGKTVTGKWDDKTDVKGTFENGALDLSFPLESPEAGPGTLAIKAKLANGEFTGNWSFQTYSGTLKATRVATPAK
jgi:hypothetical protein